MEEGAKAKRTVFVGGLGDEIDEGALYESFQTFGDIIEVQIPAAQTHGYQRENQPKHRGFAFVTFAAAGDAQDAIDNMDLNELRGRVLRVNLARPQKMTLQGTGNHAIWESEEWLREYAKPLGQSGGVGARAAARSGSGEPEKAGGEEEGAEAMEE